MDARTRTYTGHARTSTAAQADARVQGERESARAHDGEREREHREGGRRGESVCFIRTRSNTPPPLRGTQTTPRFA